MFYIQAILKKEEQKQEISEKNDKKDIFSFINHLIEKIKNIGISKDLINKKNKISAAIKKYIKEITEQKHNIFLLLLLLVGLLILFKFIYIFSFIALCVFILCISIYYL